MKEALGAFSWEELPKSDQTPSSLLDSAAHPTTLYIWCAGTPGCVTKGCAAQSEGSRDFGAWEDSWLLLLPPLFQTSRMMPNMLQDPRFLL